MDITVSPNDYNIEAIEATRNLHDGRIVTLRIREEGDESFGGVQLALLETSWQRVADALAEAGIYPARYDVKAPGAA